MRRHHRLWRAGKRRTSRDHLVGEHAEGVDVGAVIEVRVAGGLLGRHVPRCAHRRAELRQRLRGADAGCVQRLRDAEVGDLGRAAGQEDIVGLDVAVHDAARVRVSECASDVAEDARELRHRHGRAGGEPCAQRLAVDVRHGEEGQAVEVAGIEQRDDVRMLQRGRHPDLAFEALGADGAGELGGEHLRDDRAAEPRVLYGKDAGHAATTELASHGERVAECCL